MKTFESRVVKWVIFWEFKWVIGGREERWRKERILVSVLVEYNFSLLLESEEGREIMKEAGSVYSVACRGPRYLLYASSFSKSRMVGYEIIPWDEQSSASAVQSMLRRGMDVLVVTERHSGSRALLDSL